MGVDRLFELSNLFVLPFWLLMIALPNWQLTRKVIASYVPFGILASLYIYLFISAITPENAQAMANPNLVQIAGFFADPRAAATAWTHFLVMDLFVGRWIYLEGQRTGIWTFHSLLLCLFAGPMGLLSHILTDFLGRKFFLKPDIVPSGAEA